MPKRNTIIKGTTIRPANSNTDEPIDILERIRQVFYFLTEFILKSFQNATIVLFSVVLIVLGLLYLFFSLFGLT